MMSKISQISSESPSRNVNLKNRWSTKGEPPVKGGQNEAL